METLENKLIIQWSDEDDRFLVRFPIFLEQQWQTHGDLYELAVADGIEALKSLAIADESIGDRLLKPQTICRVA
ncbi:MAG: type II toxin-antitoxin system HicB family antitoxin [Cyanobacteria bacterium CAN_BIN43]|nr:type II toxin-antitoxin system HicB family antitoxin [Cyanobacteria bacterium CAN_BIN43]